MSQTGDWHASGRSRSPSCDEEALPPRETVAHRRRVGTVAAAGERDERPHPGGLDATPAAVSFLPVEDPALRHGEGVAATRLHGGARVALEEAVDVVPDVAAGVSRGPEVELAPGPRGREWSNRAVVHDDRERHHGLPSPAGEGVERDRHPGTHQRELHRKLGHLAPRPEPEQREPDSREHPGRADAAALVAETPWPRPAGARGRRDRQAEAPRTPRSSRSGRDRRRGRSTTGRRAAAGQAARS